MGFAADFFRYGEGALEEDFKVSGDGADFAGDGVGLFNLTEDLRLAYDHAVEGAGDAEEVADGWLAVYHGVKQMVATSIYRVGLVMLDLDDPTQILGRLHQPLLSPAPDERDGYVPNVVYSCGAFVHSDVLVIPYGICDAQIGFATVALPELLEALTR